MRFVFEPSVPDPAMKRSTSPERQPIRFRLIFTGFGNSPALVIRQSVVRDMPSRATTDDAGSKCSGVWVSDISVVSLSGLTPPETENVSLEKRN